MLSGLSLHKTWGLGPSARGCGDQGAVRSSVGCSEQLRAVVSYEQTVQGVVFFQIHPSASPKCFSGKMGAGCESRGINTED